MGNGFLSPFPVSWLGNRTLDLPPGLLVLITTAPAPSPAPHQLHDFSPHMSLSLLAFLLNRTVPYPNSPKQSGFCLYFPLS